MHKAKLKTKILSLLLAVSMVAGNIPETTITAIAAEAGNHAPKISADAPGMVELEVGDAYDVTQYFTDEDDDALTYTVTCDGEELGADLAAYDYEASEPGKHALAVEASDGIDQTCWNVAVIVTDTADVEHADENADDQNEDAIDVHDGENEDAVALLSDEDSVGISLDKEVLDLTVEDDAQTITVTKSDTIGDLVWESSDEKVATVADGAITPVAAGMATITVKTEDAAYSASCEVTVWDSCGTSAKWTVKDKKATLVIDGSGAIVNSANIREQPWKAVRASITTVEIGKDITRIGAFSFAAFSKLATFTIPEDSKLEEIGKNAFMGTAKLTSISLPVTIKTIDDTNVLNKEIHFRGTAAQWESLVFQTQAKKDVYVLDASGNEVKYEADPYNGKCGTDATWHFDKDKGTLTISGSGAMATYNSASVVPWYKHNADIQTVKIEKGITSVGGYAFREYTNLTTVELPETIIQIDTCAFWNDTKLTDIALENVEEFGSYSFLGCTGLTSLALTSAKNIGEQAFVNCSELTTVTLGSEEHCVEKVGKRAFNGCTALTSVTFANVKEVGEFSFQGSKLTSADLKTVEIVGQSAFYKSTDLKKVIFGKNLKSLQEGAFAYTGISSVSIPGTVTDMKENVFSGCTSMKNVSVAEGINTVSKGCFSGNTALEELSLPVTLTSVGQSAFSNCTSLKTVKYAGTREQWKNVSVEENNEPLVALMEEVINVTGIALNKSELTLNLGGATESLIATVMPENASDTRVLWSSENEKIASVDNTGKVTPVGVGVTNIIAKSVDGDFTAVCKVTVVDLDAEFDLSAFSFVATNQEISDERYQRNTLTVEKQTDGSYHLFAPTYAAVNSNPANNKFSLKISAPEGFDKEFSVTYYTWDTFGQTKTEKTETSVDGTVILENYSNPYPEKRLNGQMYGSHELEYSDFIFKVDGSNHTSRVEFSLYNELKSLKVNCKSDTTISAPEVTRTGDTTYAVTLLRGYTYAIFASGGLSTNLYDRSSAYISDGDSAEVQQTFLYTPGTEESKDFTIRITNEQQAYKIADGTYTLHVTVQDAPVKLEFEKYVVKVNDEEVELTLKGSYYTFPQLTQNDKLVIKAVVKNADDSTKFEWSRGIGLGKNLIEGNTDEIEVDTSDTQISQYWFNATATCKGMTIKLPMLRAQKVTALKLTAPEILTQPMGAEYTVGQTAEPLKVTVARQSEVFFVFDWYRCEDQDKTNPTLVFKENRNLITEDTNRKTEYTPSTVNAGIAWYYCEIYTTKAGIESKKVTSDCVKVEVKPTDIPLKGNGTEESPWMLASEQDLDVVREKVAAGSSFAGMYFAFANDIELSADWTPIGTTKDGSGNTNNGMNILPFSGTLDGRNFTVRIAEGGLPLFNIVRAATIKNLKIYGTKIEGFGLIDRYAIDYGDDGNYNTGCPEIVSIDNCHILEGTKIKNSGFIGGFASGANTVTISNCTVAKDVTIGYGMTKAYEDGAIMTTGSFAGDFNGTITNCSSAATVMGNRTVGGIVGRKGQSMGLFKITNCTFTGTVQSEGNAGGIVGSGYDNGTAPNSPCVTIEDCKVTGNITGKNWVGGILGREGEIMQCWSNGSAGIRNNEFTGKVHGDSNKTGGIIGYMPSLNKWNVIENNYYDADCGADRGIAFVKYVDTSCETHETASGATYFDTSKELPDINGVGQKNFNRTDDPLGADKEKLCSTTKRTDKYVKKLELSGEYKTEYKVGEAFDTTGMVFTATWSDDTTTTPEISEVTFSGFSSEEAGEKGITAEYKDATCVFSVNVKPNSSKIKISISVLGDEKHDNTKGPHGLTMGGLTEWAKEESFDANTSETVWDALQRVFTANKMTVDADWNDKYNSMYIKSINGIGEFDNGKLSGWMYTVNGVHPDVGVSAKYLHEGDVVIFHYTDDYSLEKDDVEGMMPAEVIRLIKEIPDKITLAAEKAITAARAAYEKLTEADRHQVTNYQKLLDAEKKLSALKHDSANARNIHAVTGNYLKGLSDKTAPTVSSIGGDWLVLGLTRSGKDVPAGYFDNVAAYVKKNINASGQLDANKSTENSRVILALTAAGFDPRNVGGYNLLNGLSDMDFIKKQGLNGPIWALIALDSHNYSIPAGTVSNPTTREKLIETILNAQLADGGWAYSGTVADSDMTGMALQALAPYYKLKTNDKLTSAVDKAIAKLSTMQKDNGAYATTMGMGSGSTITSESTSQVVVALTALGIDPNTDERFVKNGFSAVDALLDYAVDGGGFEHLKGQGMDGMATEQGYYALTSYIRMRDGKTTLYDMSDVTLKVGKVTDSGDNGNSGTTDDQAKKDQAAADKVEKLIDAIGTVTVNSETRIKKARNAYDRLTDAQKKLVSNYQDLKDAEKDLKKAKVSYVEDLIDSIGNVTLNSKTKINRARTAYDKLDKSLKDDVGNLSVLEAAEAAYKKLLDGSSTADDTAKKTTGTATGKAAGKSYGTATGKASAGTGSTGELTAIAGSVEELLDNITDDSIAGEILDAILAYEDLTTEEQAALGRDRQIEDLKKRVAELNQTDRTTGISVSGVDWNIQLVIGDVLDVETIANLKEQLQNCDMLSLWDISLEDVLTGEKYEPTGTVLVKIPLALLGDYSSYDGIAVAHYGEYGNVEYLNCTVMGDCLVFNTVEFSRYAVVGFNGAFDAEGLMTASVNADGTATPAEGMPWLPWALAGGCGAALLIVLLMLAQKKQKSEVGS